MSDKTFTAWFGGNISTMPVEGTIDYRWADYAKRADVMHCLWHDYYEVEGNIYHPIIVIVDSNVVVRGDIYCSVLIMRNSSLKSNKLVCGTELQIGGDVKLSTKHRTKTAILNLEGCEEDVFPINYLSYQSRMLNGFDLNSILHIGYSEAISLLYAPTKPAMANLHATARDEGYHEVERKLDACFPKPEEPALEMLPAFEVDTTEAIENLKSLETPEDVLASCTEYLMSLNEDDMYSHNEDDTIKLGDKFNIHKDVQAVFDDTITHEELRDIMSSSRTIADYLTKVSNRLNVLLRSTTKKSEDTKSKYIDGLSI